ncbi:two-component regulator propeller domain-containing protein [uncultured Algibacter sp.]|uniref:type IX secretion system anionic LPS delivery protein PorZ n=1 Tax=uncultured Algibacter sp. TaxID=298659 RepID=UPI003217E3B3
MYKIVIISIILLTPLSHFAQDFSELWTGHFSYLDIKDISQGENKIYAAAENAIFIYDSQTMEIEELSTIHGLSGETITAILYVEDDGLLFIGFERGLIQVYDENEEDFLSVVDIVNSFNIPNDRKNINHFSQSNGFTYISTDYGISQYDINRLEFGDTYLIGNNGTPVKVNQTAIFNGYIYAASESGLLRGELINPNLINFREWENVSSIVFNGIQTVGNKLYGSAVNRNIYEINNTILTQLIAYPSDIIGFKSFSDKLIANTKNNVFVYDEDFNELTEVSRSIDFDADFTKATILGNNDLYVGSTSVKSTGKPGFGILKTTISDTSIFEEIHPQSPLTNNFFEVKISGQEIWGIHGGYSSRYAFSGGQRISGISHFVDQGWDNIRYDSIVSKIESPFYLSHISINPFDTKQLYISSYTAGLIDFNDGDFVNLYNQNNSTITPFAGNLNLTLTSNYDNEGVLWVTNGRVDKPLNKFFNGNWISYDFTSLISERESNLGFSNIIFDGDNNLFFGSFNFGLIGFNENNGSPLLKSIRTEEENFPSLNVKALALDKSNQLWIGTDQGLRVLFNTSNFFTDDNIRVEEIIIEEDGIAKELLFQQSITNIEVDGSNNKWIGTADAGIFYFSPDGQNTIFHFTIDNSPLPSNVINDISIDNANGIVYIATSKGLVSFESGSSSPLEGLQSAFAYPNPVRPTFDIVEKKVKIKDVSENVNIKITDIEGNLVAEAQSRTNQRFKGFNLEIDGGTAYWNGKNLANNIVASGVYLVMLSDLDSFETKVLKLMVVR